MYIVIVHDVYIRYYENIIRVTSTVISCNVDLERFNDVQPPRCARQKQLKKKDKKD